jgi:hypothetical protein
MWLFSLGEGYSRNEKKRRKKKKKKKEKKEKRVVRTELDICVFITITSLIPLLVDY